MQRAVDGRAVAGGAVLEDPLDLVGLERRVDLQQIRVVVITLGVGVHPDDLAHPRLKLGLILERRVGDLSLRIAALDRLDHPADLVDLLEVRVRLLLHPIGQRLHEIRAAQRIDRVRHPRLLRDDLLGSERDPDRLLGRQRERLIKAVRMQRLGTAQHAGERLDRRAHDVVQRLLRGQRHPRRLRVKTHQQRPLVRRPERLAQLPRPDPPRRPVLRDLLKEIDVRVEEKAQPRRERVHVETPRDRVLHIRQTRP